MPCPATPSRAPPDLARPDPAAPSRASTADTTNWCSVSPISTAASTTLPDRRSCKFTFTLPTLDVRAFLELLASRLCGWDFATRHLRRHLRVQSQNCGLFTNRHGCCACEPRDIRVRKPLTHRCHEIGYHSLFDDPDAVRPRPLPIRGSVPLGAAIMAGLGVVVARLHGLAAVLAQLQLLGRPGPW